MKITDQGWATTTTTGVDGKLVTSQKVGSDLEFVLLHVGPGIVMKQINTRTQPFVLD